MKKIISLACLLLVTFSVWPQEFEYAMSVDAAPYLFATFIEGYGGGLSFEMGVSNWSAVGFTIGVMTNDGVNTVSSEGIFNISVQPMFRVYPLGAAINSLFFEAGGAFSLTTSDYQSTKIQSTYLSAIGGLGSKFIFGSTGGLFIEVSVNYGYLVIEDHRREKTLAAVENNRNFRPNSGVGAGMRIGWSW